MSIFYIRPRQDLSLATFASIICVLEAEHRKFKIYCTNEGTGGDRFVTRIYFPTSARVTVEGALDSIEKYTRCMKKDFKIIEAECNPFKKVKE